MQTNEQFEKRCGEIICENCKHYLPFSSMCIHPDAFQCGEVVKPENWYTEFVQKEPQEPP